MGRSSPPEARAGRTTAPTVEAVQTVLHFDIDAFFASVEVALRTGLEQTAVVVGGRGRRGVVSCANYEARALGLHAAMPMYRARRPDVTVLGVRHHAYREASREVEEVFRRLGDVTMHSIDEGSIVIADIDEMGMVSLTQDIEEIRAQVRTTYGLGVSVGVARSRTLAKIAGGRAKPDGLLVITPEEEEAFLRSLTLQEIPGLGPSTLERLAAAGVETVASLAQADDRTLRVLMGNAQLESVRRTLSGQDPAGSKAGRRQVSSSRTFEYDLNEEHETEQALLQVLADAWCRLHGRAVSALTLRVATPERSVSRSRRLPAVTEEPRNLTTCALGLLGDLRATAQVGPVRMLSVSLEVSESGGQDELFMVEGPDLPERMDRTVSLSEVVFKGMKIEHQVFGAGRVLSASREGLLVEFAGSRRLLDPWTLPRSSWERNALPESDQSSTAASRASTKEVNPSEPSR